ncbi:regulator of microtubule dynamics protein 3 [Hyla sarda]|uniref:regulator of microtubule dynamics protein 3 n=1 Tax=Hyla sarda TaxID=327740 RepID=UPI0024C35E95|nr:regulator of microtubule dynamics protein 3 [Hyla sarda]
MSKLILTHRVGFGLVAGVTAGVIVYMVYRERHRNCNKKETKQNGYHVHVTSDRPVSAAYSQAVSAGADLVAASRGEPLELLNRLDYVLGSIVELRQEIESLRNSLHGLAEDIVGEVRSHLEENQRANRRRRFLPPRERTDSTGSSSIYFTTSSGFAATDVESEGGYTTANAESDYDRESSRASEEEEDEVSCETVRTMRKDSDVVTDDEEETMLAAETIDEELTLLLQKSDTLHDGDDEQKREGFQLLCSNRLMYGGRQDFLWRLARSYSDICEITEDLLEKKSYALEGREEVGVVLENEGQTAECHKWFAILCGHSSEHESIQKRIQTGYIFREHIEKAILLQPNDPQCYYLLGRWCYEVSHLGWLERKTASALYDTPPSATVDEALQNLLKAEELSPGFSKALRVYIAKCYRDLGNQSEAARWLKLASELPERTQEDKKMASTIEEMMSAITA